MTKRTLAVALTGALVAAALLAPGAEAAKRKKRPKPKPSPSPAVCAPFTPGEVGAGAETIVVTDTATAEAPVTVPITLDMAIADFVEVIPMTSQAVNVQVDSAAPTAGLYVLFEFDEFRDYDLWTYWPTGEEAASAHGFQPLIDTKGTPADQSNTADNHAGESTASSEAILGMISPDCAGWTLEAQNWLGEGGDFELKIWLGEGTTEPKAPGA